MAESSTAQPAPPAYSDVTKQQQAQQQQQQQQQQPQFIQQQQPQFIQQQPQFIQQQPVYPQQVYQPQQLAYPPQGYVYPQQQVIGGGVAPVQQVQYVVQPNQVAPVGVIQRPDMSLAPHTYLIITVIVMIACAILNITSLIFGVPALVMAIMAQDYLSRGNYPVASKNGMIAMILTVVNAGYTLVLSLIIIGTTVAWGACTSSYYRYRSDYC